MNNTFEQLSTNEVAQLQKNFLDWYFMHARNLPWRENTDPYRIWISEIMLQQTRVDTVIDYFHRFMQTFPTIKDLANADDEKLLKVWEGLGYYSRARNLKVAANQIMDEYDGKFPQTPTEISKLKGIGPYTTGAISSIAFHLPEPAIDGNVMRVVSRLFLIKEDIAKASSRKVFDQAVRKIIPERYPGEFNQAFMDLGSSICTPTSPKCTECPLSSFCLSKQEGLQEQFPVKSKKAKPKDQYFVAFALENTKGAYLLEKRAAGRLLKDMLHFPIVEIAQEEYKNLLKNFSEEPFDFKQPFVQPTLFDEDTLVAEHQTSFELLPRSQTIQTLFSKSELPFNQAKILWNPAHLGEITHIFTHLKWHILLFEGKLMETTARDDFYTMQQMKELPLPKMQHKLLNKMYKLKKDF